jgi:AraC-like DNA-binding protein
MMAAIENAFRFQSKFVRNCAIEDVMAAQAEQYTVRADYAHALANACQRFVGALLTVEPGVFVCAVMALTMDAPNADSPAELLMASTALQNAVLLGALAHHAAFHRWFDASTCAFRPHSLHVGHCSSSDTFVSSLRRWAEDHARSFDEQHAWPPATRVARLLQKAPADTWYVDDVAREVCVSSATLERSFRKTYGMAVQEYHSLVRLRSVAHAVRADRSVIEGVILDLGYTSIKDVYAPLRRMTGMTLATVRELTESQFASLINGSLALPVPGCPRSPHYLAAAT